MIIKRIVAILMASVMLQSIAPTISATKEVDEVNIKIDGNKANTNENMLYRGQGMISCNGSSRLLIDYKEKNPDSYNQILEYLFGEDGLAFTHFKVEMGADVNTSSGTEPSVMRYESEVADVTRGAGFQLACDIKKINPDVTLDMLWWSEPAWVSNSQDVYGARYKWYKSTLDSAYNTYGLKFDYISANQNERNIDTDWILYLSEHIKSEKDCPYDYSKIKIVSADECGNWWVAYNMPEDETLRNAVDVIGSHYTCFATDEAKLMAEKYGKELWFSEGSAPMSYANSSYRFDKDGSGINDINGSLDIANRIITMVSGGYMTLYEYQPAVSAYYDGTTYCQKQLINASTPWNGYFSLDCGFYMNLHFSQFFKKGWAYIFDACNGDGKAGGDGHAIVDAHYSYMTACDTKTGDFSTVITNTTDSPITYNFSVTNLEKSNSDVYLWETRGPDEDQEYDENYFKKISTIKNENGKFSVTVKPSSMVSVSTLDVEEREYSCNKENTVLELPFSDDYEYNDSLSSRGNAPLYTTDQGGAFEVILDKDNNKILQQKITEDLKANEWGATPEPTTNFGDDRWYNYSVSADVLLDSEESYAGVGLRYILASNGLSGYALRLYSDHWEFYGADNKLLEGKCEQQDISKWHNLKIQGKFNKITLWVDEEQVGEYVAEGGDFSAGRASLYSSYNNCCFDNVKVEPIENVEPYITRFDNFDKCVNYDENGWTHETMSSFKNYKRTMSTGTEGAKMTFEFEGTGFALTGLNNKNPALSISIDGQTEQNINIPNTINRQISYSKYGLENKKHTVDVTVISGDFTIDGIEILGGMENKESISSQAQKKNKKSIALPLALGVGALGVLGGITFAVKKHKKHS